MVEDDSREFRLALLNDLVDAEGRAGPAPDAATEPDRYRVLFFGAPLTPPPPPGRPGPRPRGAPPPPPRREPPPPAGRAAGGGPGGAPGRTRRGGPRVRPPAAPRSGPGACRMLRWRRRSGRGSGGSP